MEERNRKQAGGKKGTGLWGKYADSEMDIQESKTGKQTES